MIVIMPAEYWLCSNEIPESEDRLYLKHWRNRPMHRLCAQLLVALDRG